MNQISTLAKSYRSCVEVPWQRTLAGAQRVIVVVYPKDRERMLRARIQEFENATQDAGHHWMPVDATTWFAEWMARDEYREAYFREPELLQGKLDSEFPEVAADRLRKHLEEADGNTVVAFHGVASLYGFLRVSRLLSAVESAIRGRLLVFFPGTKDHNNYRLLDARDGWNYLAQAITLQEAFVLRYP